MPQYVLLLDMDRARCLETALARHSRVLGCCPNCPVTPEQRTAADLLLDVREVLARLENPPPPVPEKVAGEHGGTGGN
jgi:hypothetical protein